MVLDDADVDYAVDAAVFSRYVHQGQALGMAANRILVDRTVEKGVHGEVRRQGQGLSRRATQTTR